MNWSIVIVIGVQLLFSSSDLLARNNLMRSDFTLETFLSLWFLVYFLIRMIAMFGQLYVFTSIELGKTMALFGAFSIITSNLLGFLILQERLSIGTYVGISLAALAFFIIALT